MSGRRRHQRREGTCTMYTYEVTENIATAGLGTTKSLKYRWTIKRDGVILKVGYAFTAASADGMARMKIAKIEAKGGTWLERYGAKIAARKAAKEGA